MKNKKYNSASTFGAEFEEKIDQWSNDAKLEFYCDKPLDNSKRRKKDLSTDRRFIINGKNVYIELKTCRAGQSLSYNITQSSVKRHLKFHQIAKMNFLIYEVRPNKPIVITKKNFLTFVANHKKNSITHREALKIGFEIEDMRWLNEMD